jgi:hypothetical protein
MERLSTSKTGKGEATWPLPPSCLTRLAGVPQGGVVHFRHVALRQLVRRHCRARVAQK